MSNADQCQSILLLNDDCFYHIFKFLPLQDWCSLRGTSTRLRTIADYCFKRQYETFQLLPKNVSGSWEHLLAMKDVKQLIRSFCQFIVKLTINQKHFEDYNDPGPELVPLLNRYCLDLQDLKLVKINLDAETIDRCERLFTNLHRFVIDQWNGGEAAFTRCLTLCVSLKELELIRVENALMSYHPFLDCLESFTMSCCSDFDYSFVRNLLLQNSQLTKVRFLSPEFPIIGDMMNDLAITLPNLMELSVKGSIHFFQPNMTPVSIMHSLKKIEMDCLMIEDDMVFVLLTGLAGINKLEHLHLASFNLTDKSVQQLCTLKNLKTLALTTVSHLDDKICKKLAIELPALSEVQVIQCNDATFHEINAFVVHLVNLKRIVFVRYDPDDDDDEEGPSINADIFLSLVGTRNSKPNKEILSIFTLSSLFGAKN